jgi:hypothetical protein
MSIAQSVLHANTDISFYKEYGLWASDRAKSMEPSLASEMTSGGKFQNLKKLGEYLREDPNTFLGKIQRLLNQVTTNAQRPNKNKEFIAKYLNQNKSWLNQRSTIRNRVRNTWRREFRGFTNFNGKWRDNLIVPSIMFELGRNYESLVGPWKEQRNPAFIGSVKELDDAVRVFRWFRDNEEERDAILRAITPANAQGGRRKTRKLHGRKTRQRSRK